MIMYGLLGLGALIAAVGVYEAIQQWKGITDVYDNYDDWNLQ